MQADIDLPFRSKHVSDTCLFEGCPDRTAQRGLCWGHYAQFLKFGDLRPKRGSIVVERTCGFPDCDRKHAARGWCASHRRQALDPSRPMWAIGDRPRKGRTMADGGYVKVWSPDHPNAQRSGWTLEHIVVMSAALDRPLLPNENVHHKNGDRADNRLSNLELWSHSQPKGQRVADKVAWAIELLKLYQSDVLAQ